MQIKTALSLSAGVALGWIFFEDNEKKEKAIDNFKRVMYRLQTGRSFPTEKENPKSTNYRPSYNGYMNYSTNYIMKIFDSKEKADEVLRKCRRCAEEFGTVTIGDYKDFIGKTVFPDDTHAVEYGWFEEDVMSAKVTEVKRYLGNGKIEKRWKITLPNPIKLYK